ncbi:hypothetical protein ABEB36_003214 [Hypothenemus hampei]|uniref:Exoribonuclease phosphorolytic domain-containing protein n=1 Tax=Hypothenemus hampei TaxID=57062 RepID=A0ABD1F8G4_HYPHA
MASSEFPQLKCELGVLSKSDGSAALAEGESVMLASVCGPIEVKLQKLLTDKTSVECCYRSKAAEGIQDRFRETILKNICETALMASLHPRSSILVNLQEMQNGGQLLSCAVNAACLACLNAGVDMKFTFAAVSCFLNKFEEFSFVPPINENEVKALFVLVFNSTTGSIIASHTEGSFTTEQFQHGLKLCREQSQFVFKFFKESVINFDKDIE